MMEGIIEIQRRMNSKLKEIYDLDGVATRIRTTELGNLSIKGFLNFRDGGRATIELEIQDGIPFFEEILPDLNRDELNDMLFADKNGGVAGMSWGTYNDLITPFKDRFSQLFENLDTDSCGYSILPAQVVKEGKDIYFFTLVFRDGSRGIFSTTDSIAENLTKESVLKEFKWTQGPKGNSKGDDV